LDGNEIQPEVMTMATMTRLTPKALTTGHGRKEVKVNFLTAEHLHKAGFDVNDPMHQYLRTLPAAVPAGRVLVHNCVRPRRRLGASGFRAWLSLPSNPRLVVCGCGWAAELGQHFRLKVTGA
jgi:hypothetical protein